jgi:hypothetical protein
MSRSIGLLPWLALTLLGCGAPPYDVVLRFASPALRAQAETVEVFIVPTCGALASTGEAPNAPLRTQTLRPDGMTMALGAVPPGRIGLYARALGADCAVFAAGCSEHEVTASSSGTLTTVLDAVAGPACPASAQCLASACVPTDAAFDAGADVDAAADADADAAFDADARVDAPPPGCEAGAMCGTACVDLSSNPAHCGACGHACSTIAHGTATCAAGLCSMRCDDGYTLLGTACEPVPRLLLPPSTSHVTTRRPTLRWMIAPGATALSLDLCADRACTSVLATLAGTGTSAAPSTDLPPGVVFWRARAETPSGTTFSPVWQFEVGPRSTPVDRAWGVTADLEGDGLADALVGAPGSSTAYVHPGSAGGFTSAPVTLTGSALFGQALAPAGDVDGDGYGDLLVGAPGDGTARVYLGGAGGVRTPGLLLSGRGSQFGYAVAAAGDVNGDGYGDVVVGAYDVSNAGRIDVYLGSPTGPRATPITRTNGGGPRSLFGISVAGACDVNGDGFSDVIVGASQANTVSVFGGNETGIASSPLVLRAPSGVSGFGISVACAGDVNGDGFSDVVVSASSSNAVYLYRGSPGGLSTSAITLSTGISGAHVVASARDLDQDGYGDLVVGIGSANAAFVFWGNSAGTGLTSTRLTTPSGASQFGAAVAGLGDSGGDGYGDLLIGAPGSNQVFVYRGGASALDPTPSLLATPPGAMQFGRAVACVGCSTPFRRASLLACLPPT